jgi:hypothetical protein
MVIRSFEQNTIAGSGPDPAEVARGNGNHQDARAGDQQEDEGPVVWLSTDARSCLMLTSTPIRLTR